MSAHDDFRKSPPADQRRDVLDGMANCLTLVDALGVYEDLIVKAIPKIVRLGCMPIVPRLLDMITDSKTALHALTTDLSKKADAWQQEFGVEVDETERDAVPEKRE